MAKKLLPLRNFGRFGVVHDTASQAMPIGTWSDALNMRFSGVEMEKMLEPELFAPFLGEGYSCNALDVYFQSALPVAGSVAYPLDELLANNEYPTNTPRQLGSPAGDGFFYNARGTWQGSLDIDRCEGTNSLLWDSEDFFDTGIELSPEDMALFPSASSTPGGGPLTIDGTVTFGCIAKFVSTSTYEVNFNMNGIGSGGAAGQRVGLAVSGGLVRLDLPGNIGTNTVACDDLDHVVVFVVSGTEVSCYIDNVLLETLTMIGGVSASNWTNWTSIRLLNASNFASYPFVSLGPINRTELQLAYQRNFSTYTAPGVTGNPKWMQLWSDGFSSYVAIVLEVNQQDYLYWLDRRSENDTGAWVEVGGPYANNGVWHSFEWGDTCIFNNGVNAPQMWDGQALQFVDLPNWGLISTADDISNNRAPSRDRQAACRVLVPFKNYLVACGVTEGGTYYPNKVWWSDTITFATYNTAAGGGPPSWDYESPSTNSGQSEVGLGDGKIRAAAVLNENLIIYADKSATAMQIVGGRFIMRFVRLFGKGAAAIHCVAEFNSRHFVVARDQIYVHDGSIPQLIAKDRVEEEFFIRCGKGGRFGSGTVDWDKIQVVKNPDRKEILVCFDGEPGYGSQLETPPLPECLGYSCGAIQDALTGNAEALWVFDDPVAEIPYGAAQDNELNPGNGPTLGANLDQVIAGSQMVNIPAGITGAPTFCDNPTIWGSDRSDSWILSLPDLSGNAIIGAGVAMAVGEPLTQNRPIMNIVRDDAQRWRHFALQYRQLENDFYVQIQNDLSIEETFTIANPGINFEDQMVHTFVYQANVSTGEYTLWIDDTAFDVSLSRPGLSTSTGLSYDFGNNGGARSEQYYISHAFLFYNDFSGVISNYRLAVARNQTGYTPPEYCNV